MSATINGVVYSGSVRNVSIINGVVSINGVVQGGDPLKGEVRIVVEGDLAALTTDAPVSVTGSVKGDVKADGPVTCGNVGGSVTADGPVTCGNVTGNVEADGPCTCGKVGGNVKADMVIHG